MIDKEKQIEEMAKIIGHCYCDKECQNKCAYCDISSLNEAKKLYEQGYRKLKDSVVLSKEEYEKIINQRKKARSEQKRFKRKYLYMKDNYNKASKETAEMYKVSMMLSIQEMQKYLEITEEQAKLLYYHNYQVAKQFGVEIKE